MNRQEIVNMIEALIDEYWVYFDEDSHKITARKIVEFLEDIGYDVEASVSQRITKYE